MTLEQLQITLNPGTTDAREYDIFPIDRVELTSRKEAFSIAPPGLGAADNILLGISGMQADITIDAYLWDATGRPNAPDPDRANGTAPTGVFANDTVVTIEEQLKYLEDYIHAPDFSAAWTLDHLTGSAFNDDGVFIESIEPTVLNTQERNWRSVRFTLRRGESVG